MNVLILGAGGREHAFARKIAQSNLLENLYIAPGNAGTLQYGTNIPVDLQDFGAIKNIVIEKEINLVLVGPEEPLVQGIHDYFLADIQLQHIAVIGPTKDGAQLEGSKEFSKRFMQKYGIPTARYQSFTKETIDEGRKFLETLQPPFVLKADGLAAGKGVLILDNLEEAKQELERMLLEAKFGTASEVVVIEEFLSGRELSVFVLTDGNSYKLLPTAKDYKRVGEHDTGPNTGGMGAVSPVPFADELFMKKVKDRIITPTLAGLQAEGIDYRWFIFIGLMNCDGNPRVIEYNCRMGDPETEVVIPRISSDLLELLYSVATQTLESQSLEITSQTAATVVLVSGGYPGEYEINKVVYGIETSQDSLIFHSATTSHDKEVLTAGGRVLVLTSLAESIEEAVQKSMRLAETISYENKYYRRDIGEDLVTEI